MALSALSQQGRSHELARRRRRRRHHCAPQPVAYDKTQAAGAMHCRLRTIEQASEQLEEEEENRATHASSPTRPAYGRALFERSPSRHPHSPSADRREIPQRWLLLPPVSQSVSQSVSPVSPVSPVRPC